MAHYAPLQQSPTLPLEGLTSSPILKGAGVATTHIRGKVHITQAAGITAAGATADIPQWSGLRASNHTPLIEQTSLDLKFLPPNSLG